MTKVLVLSNLPISVFEHKNMFYVSFVLSLKIIFYRYIGISVNFYNGGFLSLVLVSHFTHFSEFLQWGFSIAGARFTFYPV